MMRILLSLVMSFSFFISSWGQLMTYQIPPVATDANINPDSDLHLVYLDKAAPPLNKLLLFFPGTNASGEDYTLFLKTAARLGYHVIGLDYENDISLNLEVCPATQDLTCLGRARAEIWTGNESHDAVNVNVANSIINRLQKLLQYLSDQYPEEQWNQFLEQDSAIQWQKIATAGHSQGAGHATFASKLFEVNRVVMVSWIDWVFPGTNPTWVTAPGPTPDSAYYGFIHTGDASIFNGIPTTWNNLGVLNFGPITSIDTIAPPYNYTHALITSAPIDTTATQTNFHNATLVDWVTPMNDMTTKPIFQPVWEYLLVGNNQISDPNALRISPPGASYIDPEILSSENKIAFQTGAGSVWLSDLNPLSGTFVSANGLDIMIDNNATPLLRSFNGPEFGVDAQGWSVFYTKPNGAQPQIWRANVNGTQVTNMPLTSGNVARLSNLATKSPNSPSIRLVYAKGPSLDESLIAFTDEDQPNAETVLDSLDDGARWIDQTRSFAYVKKIGPNAGQIAIYDTDTQSEIIITNDPDVKTYSYGWFAPEYNELLVLCILNDAQLAIYKNNGGAFWERIITLDPPAEAYPFRYFGSPEPFVAGGKSYISFVLKQVATTSSYVDAQTWVMGIEANPAERLMLRCDDGNVAIRTDPESYLGAEQVFIYYNQINSRGEFEIWRYATGIPTTTTTSTEEPTKNEELCKVFPNPTSGLCNIQINRSYENIEIAVYDLLGKKIITLKNQTTFDISMLPTGTYLLQISIDGLVRAEKLVRY